MLKSRAYAIYTVVRSNFNCKTIRVTNFGTFATSIAVSLVEEYAFGKSPKVKEPINCTTSRLDE